MLLVGFHGEIVQNRISNSVSGTQDEIGGPAWMSDRIQTRNWSSETGHRGRRLPSPTSWSHRARVALQTSSRSVLLQGTLTVFPRFLHPFAWFVGHSSLTLRPPPRCLSGNLRRPSPPRWPCSKPSSAAWFQPAGCSPARTRRSREISQKCGTVNAGRSGTSADGPDGRSDI